MKRKTPHRGGVGKGYMNSFDELHNTRPDTDFRDHAIDLPAGAAGQVRTTCPECSTSRKKANNRCLSISVDDGTWLCHHCGWTGGLRRGTRFPANVTPIVPDAVIRKSERDRERIEEHRQGAVDLRHQHAEPVRRYLRHRGLGAVLEEGLPRSLFAIRSLPYWNKTGGKPVVTGSYPVMLAAVANSRTEIVSYHRTYLRHDGQGKAPVPSQRKILPPAMLNGLRGAAIRLYPSAPDLILCEGIETALAAHLLTELPAWSTISARGLETVAVPDHVTQVHIYGDHDDAGKRAAYRAGERLHRAGHRVWVAIPERPGDDWLDVYLRQGAAA